MRLDGFTICTDKRRNVKGLQFFLSETPYMVEGNADLLLILDPIGNMEGECGTLRLSGPVDKIKAAAKKNKEVRALSFHYEDKIVEIGDMDGFRVKQ